MLSTVFVTGGTGHQSGAVARHLLLQNFTVHILTRSPFSAASQVFKQLGAILFPGDFDDISAIREASKGATALFLNPYPSMTDPGAEIRHAQNLIDAAREANIQAIVYSGMILIDQLEQIPGWPAYQHVDFLLSKRRVEDMDRASGITYRTILRAGVLNAVLSTAAEFHLLARTSARACRVYSMRTGHEDPTSGF
jgi:uncharacterized protein YbjT (DUF2867 family)